MKSFLLPLLLASALTASAGPDTSDRSTKHVRTVTNYVRVPVICAALDLADVELLGGHAYRLYVADGVRPWRNWGALRPATNVSARLWFPAASTRPLLWQLVDVTPGFNQVAVTKQAPDCTAKAQWVVLGLGNIRPVR
jgi:hypothetical protein